MKTTRICLVLILILLISYLNEAKKRKKNSKEMILRQKETNAINFLRLAVMRLVYGFAVRFGFGEQISEALNGAFIPPGVDDYDDYGGFAGGDDDYDY